MYFTNTVGTVLLSKHTTFFFYNTKQNRTEKTVMHLCAGYTYDELCSFHCCSYHWRQDILMSVQICDTTGMKRLTSCFLKEQVLHADRPICVEQLRARFGCL